MRKLMILLALLLLGPLAAGPASAQEEFGKQEVQFELYDEDGRPYEFRSGQAYLAVRLLDKADNPALEGIPEISAEDLTYTVGGTDREVEILGNVARPVFVVYADPQREPLRYHLSLLRKDQDPPVEVPFAPGQDTYDAGPLQEQAAAAEPRTSTERAPKTWEYAALGALGVVGALFAYLVLARSLFRKMLFGARMAVGTALTLSNLLFLAAFLLLVLAVALAWFFPVVTGGRVLGYPVPYLGYLTAAASYLALLGLAWTVGHLTWR